MGQKVGSVRWASTFVTYCMGEPRWIRRVYANAQSSRNGVVDRPLAWYPGDPTLIPDNLQQGYSFLQLKNCLKLIEFRGKMCTFMLGRA